MLCDGNAEMQHILHKHFITWAIIQYVASNRVLKMDSSTPRLEYSFAALIKIIRSIKKFERILCKWKELKSKSLFYKEIYISSNPFKKI